MGVSNLLYFIAGIATILVLIGVALNLWWNSYFQEKIEGDKQYVLSSIANLIYKCFEVNNGRKESVICNQLMIKSTEEINSNDITSYIDPSRVTKIEVDDLGSSSEIIIRYENEVIYVEKVENERISS